MASENLVILIGHLGRDPELRYTPGGSAVTSVSLATSEFWKDKEGDRQERTEWHRVVFFDRLAEVVDQYLCKGSNIYVKGKLRTRKWTDKDGVEKYTTEILANAMQMLGGKRKGGDAPDGEIPGEIPTGEATETELDADIPF